MRGFRLFAVQCGRLSRSKQVVVLASSSFPLVSLVTALIIILRRLLFRLDDNFRLVVLGWTFVVSPLLGEGANGNEAGHTDRQHLSLKVCHISGLLMA